MHLKPSTQPPQAQSGQGQQELQVASGTASPEALGNVGDVCSERRVLQGLGARAMPVHGAVGAYQYHRDALAGLHRGAVVIEAEHLVKMVRNSAKRNKGDKLERQKEGQNHRHSLMTHTRLMTHTKQRTRVRWGCCAP